MATRPAKAQGLRSAGIETLPADVALCPRSPAPRGGQKETTCMSAAAWVDQYGDFLFFAIAIVTAITIGHWIARH